MASLPPARRDSQPAPSFEFEDGTPATPSAPDEAGAPAPAFNPFADQKVATGPAAPLPSAPAADSRAVPAAAPEAVIDDGAVSKDLWFCPHCGCGNQKKRDLCRACDKSPLAPVKVPWIRTVPGMVISAVGALVLLLGILSWCSTDKSFHPPGAKRIDSKVRIWGGLSDVNTDLGDNRTFTKRGMLAVSGRVLAAKSQAGYKWITTVVLALGDEACVDSSVSGWSTSISENSVTSSAPSYAVLHCIFPEDAELVTGSWLSLIGPRGSVTNENIQLVPFTTNPSHFVVKVERFEVK